MSSTTPDPSNAEIVKAITLAGELKTSVKDIEGHAKDALKGGHSKIVGMIPAFKYYNDPTGHPEVLNDPLYDDYILIRRIFAASYIAKILGKNANKSKEIMDSAIVELELLTKNYNNMLLAGEDTGIEGAAASIATVSSKKKTYPANEEGEIFRSPTIKGSFFNHKPNF